MDTTQDAEPCTACRWAFAAVGAAVGLLLLYMAADVALDGAITARLGRTPAQVMGLAPVIDLTGGASEPREGGKSEPAG